MAFLVTWTFNGKTGEEWFPDHTLQSVMDRVNARFGSSRILSGPDMTSSSNSGSPITPKQRTKKSGGRRGG